MTCICFKKKRRFVEKSQTSRMIGPTRTSPKLPEQQQQSSNDKTAEYDHLSGDGLRIKKTINKDNLWIKGDGCRVKFATNTGRLRINGDGCRVHINCNLGTIEYNGDGGHIIIGNETMQELDDRIVYKGDGGLIDFVGKKKYFVKNSSQDDKKETTTTTTTHTSKTSNSHSDMRTKVVGSNNVQIRFNLRIHDKSS